MRASALESTDLTSFILPNAVQASDTVIECAERFALSKRDSMRVLGLLDRPSLLSVQGSGLGGQLLLCAARRCLAAAQKVGGTVLFIDAKSERAA
jgi:hypothetical protein